MLANVEQDHKYKIVVPCDYTLNQRLDSYIAFYLPSMTRTQVQKAIKMGWVQVNNQHKKPSYIPRAGDNIDIDILEEDHLSGLQAENIPLDIMYEDDDIIVINKPSGLVVHPAAGNWEGTLINGLLYHGKMLSEQGINEYRPGIVHRLDKDTSGVLVVAKNNKAHNHLAVQFHRHSIYREYVALVWGHPPREGVIETLIGRNPRDRKKMAVLSHKGKHAITLFKSYRYYKYNTLLKAQLKTGRTHQIRVHFQYYGHPVFGDITYDGIKVPSHFTSMEKNKYKEMLNKLNRQCLHARSLGFIHPTTKKELFFKSPLPRDFLHTLHLLKDEL